MHTHPPIHPVALEMALADWSAAVDALVLDIERVAKGRASDPDVTKGLVDAVEVARKRCEAVRAARPPKA